MNVFAAPGRYVQGVGVLDDAGRFVAPLGRRAFALVDPAVRETVWPRLARALAAASVDAVESPFGGECAWSEIDRQAVAARAFGADVVLGVGGGKGLDAAKGVAYRLGVRMAMIPTAASNDAPCSSIAVVYTDAHAVQEVLTLGRNPDLVLVDVAVVARAPVRLLSAGMGDALSTAVEARACAAAGGTNVAGGRPTAAAVALADLCTATIEADGVAALEAARAQRVTPALERVVEANVLLSGLGFESGGLALAHSLHAGLALLEETAPFLHGEKVAYGTLVQIVVEGDLARAARTRRLLEELGLPTRLADLGLGGADDARLGVAAERACAPQAYTKHMPVPVTPGSLVAAMRATDRLV